MLRLLHRLGTDRAGNVTMIFALGAPILMFAVAIGIDVDLAVTVKSKLNAAADAAAVSGLTPAMLQASDTVAKAAVTAMFNARAAEVSTLTANQTQLTVTITHPNNNALQRQITVSYAAQTNAIFSGVLKTSALTLSGTSTARASVPPNIDFYLLLDNSPSMSLPATSAGITKMQSLTSMQYGGAGCAFACHQAATNNSDTIGNPCSDHSTALVLGFCPPINLLLQPITQIDNYTLARWNNITLRLDELSSGVTQLMQTASTYQSSAMFATPPRYRFAAYEMDLPWTVGTSNQLLMTLTSNYISQWSTASANFGVMEMFANSFACGNSACSWGVYFDDVATNYDVAMSSINSAMPNPGQGSNQIGDTPQEVLFFVTDGVEDELNINRLIQPINGNTSTNYCTLIKNRGIKIAVLYTEYLPVPANSFYVSNVAPIQSSLGPALQACASPNLFYDAAIGADLGAALATLFQTVVQSASLTH